MTQINLGIAGSTQFFSSLLEDAREVISSRNHREATWRSPQKKCWSRVFCRR